MAHPNIFGSKVIDEVKLGSSCSFLGRLDFKGIRIILVGENSILRGIKYDFR